MAVTKKVKEKELCDPQIIKRYMLQQIWINPVGLNAEIIPPQFVIVLNLIYADCKY